VPRSWAFPHRAAIEAIGPPCDPAAGSEPALVAGRADDGRSGDHLEQLNAARELLGVRRSLRLAIVFLGQGK